MRRVIWTPTARDDYFDILHYIAADNPEAAHRVIDKIEAVGNALGEFATGHPGRVTGTYEKTVRRLPWILVYALTDEDRAVSILRVIHAARDWPAQSWPD